MTELKVINKTNRKSNYSAISLEQLGHPEKVDIIVFKKVTRHGLCLSIILPKEITNHYKIDSGDFIMMRIEGIVHTK